MVTRKIDHIVLVTDVNVFRESFPDADRSVESGGFYCKRCGDYYNPSMPCSFAMMDAMMNTFMDEHEECEVGAE